MLELHNVMIGQRLGPVSATVESGNVLSIMGSQGSGKTTLLRVLAGFVGVSGGHITMDGELLTPLSAPWFRRQMAYVPSRLDVPEGYDEVPTDYIRLLEHAAHAGSQLLLVDEPAEPLGADDALRAARLLREAAARGATVVAVNMREADVRVEL